MRELIDKRKLLNTLCKDCEVCKKVADAGGEPHQCWRYRLIAEQPVIEAEPVHFCKWLPTKLKGYYECSACRFEHTANPEQRFCSYCGAKLDGGDH